MFLINIDVPGGKGARAGGLVCPTGQNEGSRLRGLISCLVFVPRLDHPYMDARRHVLDRKGGLLILQLIMAKSKGCTRNGRCCHGEPEGHANPGGPSNTLESGVVWLPRGG